MKKSVLMLALAAAIPAAAHAGPEVPPEAQALDAAVKRMSQEQQEAFGVAGALLAFTWNCSEFLDEPSYYEAGKTKVMAGLDAHGIATPMTEQLIDFVEGSSPRFEQGVTGTLCDLNAETTFAEAVEQQREMRNRLDNRP